MYLLMRYQNIIAPKHRKIKSLINTKILLLKKSNPKQYTIKIN